MWQKGEQTDRRAIYREVVHGSATLLINGISLVKPCTVRNLSLQGTSLRLNGLALIPLDFDMSFDGVSSTFTCRLGWRDGDLVGLKFVYEVR